MAPCDMVEAPGNPLRSSFASRGVLQYVGHPVVPGEYMVECVTQPLP